MSFFGLYLVASMPIIAICEIIYLMNLIREYEKMLHRQNGDGVVMATIFYISFAAILAILIAFLTAITWPICCVILAKEYQSHIILKNQVKEYSKSLHAYMRKHS